MCTLRKLRFLYTLTVRALYLDTFAVYPRCHGYERRRGLMRTSRNFLHSVTCSSL